MEKITKEEIKKLIKIEGKVKGEVFKTDAEYILTKKGEEGLKRVQKETKKLGYPIDYQKINSNGWYPVGLRIVSLLAVMEAFSWGEKEIENMGKSAPKISYMVKIFAKFFISSKRAIETTPRLWPRHYTIGNIKIVDFNERKENQRIKGSCLIKLRDFKVHPILCIYLKGYFSTIPKMGAEVKKLTIEEIKCPFKGDSFHQYSAKWVR